MNPLEIIALINNVIRVGGLLIEAGKDITPLATVLYDDLFGGKTITPEQGAAISAKVSQLETEALAELPPAEPGEL